MKLQILGTSAAEGWPALFCRCEYCQKARKLGGKNVRTRSSAMIDDTIKIDFPPDTFQHTLRFNIDMSNVQHLFFTHTHSDHMYADDLAIRTPVFAKGVDHPLHIYGHDLAIHHAYNAIDTGSDRYRLQRIQPFETITIDDGTRVTALPADHNKRETCLLYAVEKNGKALFYGHDSGWFPDETWDWLLDRTFDAFMLDCTNGPLPGRENHMDIDAVLDINNIVRKKNVLRPGGKVIATHFSHNGGLLHEELEHVFTPHDVTVAYDGIVISL